MGMGRKLGCTTQMSTLAGCFVFVAALGLVLAIVAFLNDLDNREFRTGPRNAEVKRNLHEVQLALERYAVDHDRVYPLFVMGGDWSDPYVVSEEHRRAEGLDQQEPAGYFGSLGRWEPAPPGMGDALVLEGYLPEYPANPFTKQRREGRLRLAHMDHRSRLTERYCGGGEGRLTVEVFGPLFVADSQPIAGDFFVHHIFNDPPYTMRDVTKSTTAEGNTVDFAVMSGNPWLVGNFSYYPNPKNDDLPWLRPGRDGSYAVAPVFGYSLAGYGSFRTHGQDVYNRNGNYKGRFRTEGCDTDCSPYRVFVDDVPCICPGDESKPSHLINNGGPDTLPDGVIFVLESGLDQIGGRVLFQDGGDEPGAAEDDAAAPGDDEAAPGDDAAAPQDNADGESTPAAH